MDIEKLIQEYEKKLLTIKKRYYYISDFLTELEKRTAGRSFEIKNDIIWQMMTDSYSMLIIDLASLYKNLGEQGGLFGLLKNHSSKLRKTSHRKIDVEDESFKRLVAGNIEQKLVSLFPQLAGNSDQKISHKDIDDLKDRILKRADEVYDDRDNLRAHRFQKGDVDKASLKGLTISELKKHFDYLEDFLGALRLITLKSTTAFDDMNNSHAGKTAEDMVDLIAVGSIQDVFTEFGIPEALEATDGPQYYYQFRDKFYEANPSPYGTSTVEE